MNSHKLTTTCDACHHPVDEDEAHLPHDPGCNGAGCRCDYRTHPECCWDCDGLPEPLFSVIDVLRHWEGYNPETDRLEPLPWAPAATLDPSDPAWGD